MPRYPHITGHALCVIAAGVGLAGSFYDQPAALAVAAVCGSVGFFLLMRSSPDGLVSAPSGKALNRPTPPRGG